jgi:hypothetical protein
MLARGSILHKQMYLLILRSARKRRRKIIPLFNIKRVCGVEGRGAGGDLRGLGARVPLPPSPRSSDGRYQPGSWLSFRRPSTGHAPQTYTIIYVHVCVCVWQLRILERTDTGSGIYEKPTWFIRVRTTVYQWNNFWGQDTVLKLLRTRAASYRGRRLAVEDDANLLRTKPRCWWRRQAVEDDAKLLRTTPICWGRRQAAEDDAKLLNTTQSCWERRQSVEDDAKLLRTTSSCWGRR